MISLEIDGIEYNNFTKISASRSYTAVPSKFNFIATTSAEDPTLFPILTGQRVRVLVDEQTFITGFIQNISVSHSATAHDISVNGESVCIDLIDSTMDSSFVISTPVSFINAINYILALAESPISARIESGLKVDDFTVDDTIEGEVGESVWSFICKLAISKSLLVTEEANGNILFTQGAGVRSQHSFIKRVNDERNNVLTSNVSYSISDRFRTYIMKTQKDSKRLNEFATDDNISIADLGYSAQIIDPAIRSSRFICTIAEKSSSLEELELRCGWQANVKNSKSFNLKLTTVSAMGDDNHLIEPGNIVYVDDQYSDINADLIVSDVNVSYSSEGSKAEFTLIDVDSYTAQSLPKPPEETGQNEGRTYDGTRSAEVIAAVHAAAEKSRQAKEKAAKEQGTTVEKEPKT